MVSVSKLPRLHQRNGVYYFRVKLPDEIKVFFGGRKEIKKSLMTCNLSVSLERYDRINRSTEKLFNAIRRILITGTDKMLTEQQIAQLVDSYSRETLSVIREEKAEKGHVETLPVLDELERIDEQLHDADYSRIMRTTKRILEESGVTGASEGDLKLLSRQLLLVQKETLQAAYLQPEAVLKSTTVPTEIPAEVPVEVVPSAKATKLMSEAINLKLQQMEADKLTKKTLQEAQGKLSVWLKILGDKDVTLYSYEEMLSVT